MVNKSIIGSICALLAVVSFNANAAVLEGRLPATPGGTDYQAYYEPDAGLTWLTSAVGISPNWAAANAWVAGLNINDVTGWRLPYTNDVEDPGATFTDLYQGVDFGYNITKHSELSNMFYNVLGNLAYYDTLGNPAQPNWGLRYDGPFLHLQDDNYWSATEYAPNTNYAWVFDMNSGMQDYRRKNTEFSVWAVHSGDVGAVPVPAAAWLFGSGLIGLIGIARRKKA